MKYADAWEDLKEHLLSSTIFLASIERDVSSPTLTRLQVYRELIQEMEQLEDQYE